MTNYLFKLKKAYIPDLTHKNEKDKLYGGIRLTYEVYLVRRISIFRIKLTYFKKKLGLKTFLCPYKKYWDTEKYFLPHAYWGNRRHPLTRLWVILLEDTPLGADKIVPQESLIHHNFRMFDQRFKSKEVATYLFSKSNKFYI
jgi:hypothetical protein